MTDHLAVRPSLVGSFVFEGNAETVGARCDGCEHWEPFWIGGEKTSNPDTGEVGFYETWGLTDEVLDDDGTIRSDDSAKRIDWGVCQRQSKPDRPMFTVDGSEYYSTLSTRAEFWCAAFEKKETTDG